MALPRSLGPHDHNIKNLQLAVLEQHARITELEARINSLLEVAEEQTAATKRIVEILQRDYNV